MSPLSVSPSSSALARPKSAIQTTPSVSSSRFDGLMSRWTIPRHGRRRGRRRPAGQSEPGCGRTPADPTRPMRAGHRRAGSPRSRMGRPTGRGAGGCCRGPVASPTVAFPASVHVSAKSDPAARLSGPFGVARPPARAPAGIDGEAPAGSGSRPPGSNRPVRMDRTTAPTSTPSPMVGSRCPGAGAPAQAGATGPRRPLCSGTGTWPGPGAAAARR